MSLAAELRSIHALERKAQISEVLKAHPICLESHFIFLHEKNLGGIGVIKEVNPLLSESVHLLYLVSCG